MKVNLKGLVLATIAVVAGFVVLIGYFIDILGSVRQMLVQWAVILMSVALLVGIVNLLRVHFKKVTTRQAGGFYSIFMIGSFFITLGVALVFGPTSSYSLWIFQYVQLPVEMSLMAILAVVLIYGSARLLYRKRTIGTLIFSGTVLLVLVGTISFPLLDVIGVNEVRAWVTQVWAVAGARGLLLGIALGTIATGLRVLIGSDRPYGE